MASAIDQEIYSVSQLNAEVGRLLETAYTQIWVEGEISNLARPASGHLYFTLKDSAAQVRCALFRNRALRLRMQPANGDRVRMQARVGLYAPRGEYQLIAEHLEPAGDGDLQQAFEQLKNKLQAEGLFAAERKKALPTLPRRIGVVTSPSGAAIRDVLSVLKRRFPALAVLIYPTRVQGEGAVSDLVAAIETANARAEVDVLVITRGGGSLEDLQAFNDEAVARAVAGSTLPVVSAVGHEVDISICDLVADERAATPSAAAERLSPDGEALARDITAQQLRLHDGLRRLFTQRQSHLAQLNRRLQSQHPGRQMRERTQRLDELQQRLAHAISQRLQQQSQTVTNLQQRLTAVRPDQRIQTLNSQRRELTRRLTQQMREQLASRRAALKAATRALDAVSPLATLNRGYAIVHSESTGEILRDVSHLQVGEHIRARVHHGELSAKIERIDLPDAET